MAPPAKNFPSNIGGSHFYKYTFPSSKNSLSASFPYTPNISPGASPTSTVFLHPTFAAQDNPFTFQDSWKEDYMVRQQQMLANSVDPRRREYTVPCSPPTTDASLSDGSSGPSMEDEEDEEDDVEMPASKRMKPWLPLTSENLMRIEHIVDAEEPRRDIVEKETRKQGNSVGNVRRQTMKGPAGAPSLGQHNSNSLGSSQHPPGNYYDQIHNTDSIDNEVSLYGDKGRFSTSTSSTTVKSSHHAIIRHNIVEARAPSKPLSNFRIILPARPTTAPAPLYTANRYPDILNPVVDDHAGDFPTSKPNTFYTPNPISRITTALPRTEKYDMREVKKPVIYNLDNDEEDDVAVTPVTPKNKADKASFVDLTSDGEEYKPKSVTKKTDRTEKIQTRSSQTTPKDATKIQTLLNPAATTPTECKKKRPRRKTEGDAKIRIFSSSVIAAQQASSSLSKPSLKRVASESTLNTNRVVQPKRIKLKVEKSQLPAEYTGDKTKYVEPPSDAYPPGELPVQQHKFLGLTNLKQTCYANSVVQVLFLIPTLRDRLIATDLVIRPGKKEAREYAQASITHRRPMSTRRMTNADVVDYSKVEPLDLWEALGRLFRALYYNDCAPQITANKRTPVCTEMFFDAVATNLSYYSDHKVQQDAHEYFVRLSDKLGENPAAATADGDIVSSMFSGVNSQKLVCKACGHASETTQRPLQGIFLPLPPAPYPLPKGAARQTVKAEDCLRNAYAPDTVAWPEEGEGQRQCKFCNSTLGREKHVSIEHCPEILLLTASYFDFVSTPSKPGQPSSGKTIKKRLDLTFPTELDMGPYMKQDDPEDEGVAASQTDALYELFSVVYHNGESSDSGHYYTKFKAGDGQWWTANDDKVGNSGAMKKGDTPYLLFYRRARAATLTTATNTPAAVTTTNTPVGTPPASIETGPSTEA